MPRYIDADALRYIESDKDAYTEDWNDDYERGFCDAINKLLGLPTVEAEPVKGWISVKERLPKMMVNT